MDRIEKALGKAKRDIIQKRTKVSAISGQMGAKQPQQSGAAQTKVIPCLQPVMSKNRIISSPQLSNYMDVYRVFRTQVLQQLRQNNWTTFGITSPTAGNGKTLTSINLAISMAKEVNHTVLLVDLDLRRPNIAKLFGYTAGVGISDYILANTPLSQIMFSPSIQRLVVLPGSQPFDDSSEMITSPKMARLVTELKTRYLKRLILFDLPPMLATDDALAFSRFVDAMLVVVEEGKTQKPELEHTMRLLKDANILGTVLNKSTAIEKGYYGYY